MGGKTVVADAQFGIARILRPYPTFTTVYEGKPAWTQIMMTEVVNGTGGDAIDAFAAASTAGYDPNLVKGLSVPIGSRVIIWFPKLFFVTGDTTSRYRYTLQWRLRNVFDFRQGRTPYHYPKQSQGIPDTTGGSSSPRVVIPAANQTVIYNQEPQPAGAAATVAANMRIEDITPGGDYPSGGASDFRGLPFNPSGQVGVIQQGIMDPASGTFGGQGVADAAFYQTHEVQAVGDELLIGLWRPTVDGAANWTFNGADTVVRNFFGSNPDTGSPLSDLGIYVMCGSAP